MGNPNPPEIQELVDEVNATIGVQDSAEALINGIQRRIEKAVTEALQNNPGVDLSPLTALRDALRTEREELAAAVAANQEQS